MPNPPSSHKAGYLLCGVVMLPSPLTSGSITWGSCHSHGQHLWAATAYADKKLYEAVFLLVLLLPAPSMLTQSLFGLYLRRPSNSCVTSNTSSTPVLILLSKGD